MTPKVVETAYTRKHPKEWKQIGSFAELVCDTFRKICPEQHKKQRGITPNYEGLCQIGKSLYSTVAVLRNYRREEHTDCGCEGYSAVVPIARSGEWSGCFLGLPKYKVCFDLRPGDLMIFNSHLKHCSTEVSTSDPEWHRLTAVFFFRKKLHGDICRGIMEARRKRALQICPQAKGEKLHQLMRKVIQDEFDEEQARKAAKCAETHATRLADPKWKLWKSLQMWKKITALQPSARKLDYFNADTEEWSYEKLQTDLVALYGRGRVVQYSLEEEWFTEKLAAIEENPQAHIVEYLRARIAWWKTLEEQWQKNKGSGVFTWPNEGNLAKSFFKMCDSAKIFIETEQLSQGHDFLHYQNAFLAHALRTAPLLAGTLPIHKLEIKFMDWRKGGAYYGKVVPEFTNDFQDWLKSFETTEPLTSDDASHGIYDATSENGESEDVVGIPQAHQTQPQARGQPAKAKKTELR